ncbi:hypothetical protein C5B42_01135 [Candidatus Cerribacteria bacterium 'Amazon FNV 2010 28 9']|uniref:Glycosyl transferase family 1 domain-containing protein n=1 Tax=Candidatus Cerribacteria bacterium 'Amazon FNV 2010 28 9' TaxID=2081795 RepID=A0A317JQ52_9BACT|nr:MAG: hypothetical protein C5B42_01135 [Candidatus Cerribacteria bacterium 'Amazon FNV 2010 28 9']
MINVSDSTDMRPKVGVDCRLSGIKHAGIGRYIEELVHVVTTDTSIHWILFFEEEHQLPWVRESDHISIRVVPIRHYTLREQLIMPIVFGKEKLDLLHVPHFNVPLLYRKFFVVTIHDLLWHEQRGSYVTTLSPLVYGIKYRGYRFVTNWAMTHSQAIFVPARTVQQSIKRLMPSVDERKIHVTYEGVEEKWFEKEQVSRNKYQGRKEKILFYTGSLYPHKNVLFVVRSLKQLPEYKLYISSSRDVFVEHFLNEVKKHGLSERVIHLGRLSDDELKTWYEKAFALVQSSLSEGFGLTGIEAMASGLPVLASDIAIFKEIYGNAFIAFDPHSEASLVNAVRQLEKSDYRALVNNGKKQAQRYSWQRMGEQTLGVYKQFLQHV